MPESFARLLCPALRFLFGFPSRALICRQTNGIRNRVGGYGVEAPLLIKYGFAGKPKCGRTNLRSGLSALLHAFFGKGKTKGIAVRFEKTVIGRGDFVGEGERNDPSAVHILEIPLCGCGLTAFSCAKKGVLLYRIEHRFTRLCDFFRAGAAAGELYGLRLLDDGLWEPQPQRFGITVACSSADWFSALKRRQ